MVTNQSERLEIRFDEDMLWKSDVPSGTNGKDWTVM